MSEKKNRFERNVPIECEKRGIKMSLHYNPSSDILWYVNECSAEKLF